MTEQQIMRLTPIQRLAYFIRERESVRIKKEAGEPKPWTTDKILQSYRFTNVRRADDKVSRWLLDNWYIPHFDHPNMVVAVALARFFNLPKSLNEITLLVFGPTYAPKTVKRVLREMKSSGETIFNAAYMVRGNDGIDKVECVVDHYVQPLFDKPPQIHRDSMESTWRNLLPYYGMGSFMAGQIVADLRHAMKGSWKDCNSWAPVGPGSSKGLAWTLYESDRDAAAKEFVAHPERFSEVLTKELVPALREHLPMSIKNRLEAMDYQSTCCEIFKYNKVLFGEGRPKQKYPGLDWRQHDS